MFKDAHMPRTHLALLFALICILGVIVVAIAPRHKDAPPISPYQPSWWPEFLHFPVTAREAGFDMALGGLIGYVTVRYLRVRDGESQRVGDRDESQQL